MTPIEARLFDDHGKEVEGYFWYTGDVIGAMHDTLERANDENVGWSSIQLVFDDGTGETLVAECWDDAEPHIYYDRV